MDPRTDDAATEMARIRRGLRGLVALELVQTALGVGALLVIGVRAFLGAHDAADAASVGAALLLALAFLALALRVRMGQELMRRDLHALEILEEHSVRSNPYREGSRTLSAAGRGPR